MTHPLQSVRLLCFVPRFVAAVVPSPVLCLSNCKCLQHHCYRLLTATPEGAEEKPTAPLLTFASQNV